MRNLYGRHTFLIKLAYRILLLPVENRAVSKKGNKTVSTDDYLRLSPLCVAQAVGCDGRVGSAAKRDMCHVCGGNNGTCQRVAAVTFPSADFTLKTRNPQRSTLDQLFLSFYQIISFRTIQTKMTDFLLKNVFFFLI